jgi:hypothetical protein
MIFNATAGTEGEDVVVLIIGVDKLEVTGIEDGDMSMVVSSIPEVLVVVRSVLGPLHPINNPAIRTNNIIDKIVILKVMCITNLTSAQAVFYFQNIYKIYCI